MKYIILLLTIFLSFGCEDKIISKIYDKNEIGKKVTKVSLSETNQSIREVITLALKDSDFNIISGSPYVLEFDTRRYTHKCNNPNSSAYDRTYDGFVQLRLLKNLKPLYSCQKDYHGEFDEDIIKELLEKMKSDLSY